MAEARGYSVRIFLPTGEPEGLRIVEKSNWTGRGLVFPRSLFGQARQRPETNRAGVYILWGPSESGQLPPAYIGESDSVRTRLEDHIRRKDFWTHGLIFTSKDQNLNKAHVQHLEARLCKLAADAKRCKLENGNVPQLPELSEADAADAEGFLADLLLCLPILGVSFFDKAAVPERSASATATTETSKEIRYLLSGSGIAAAGYDRPDGFVVEANSQAAKADSANLQPYLVALRRSLVENGVFGAGGETYRLTLDYAFTSPSTAAGALLGRHVNGRTEWKDEQGRSLKDIKDAEANDS